MQRILLFDEKERAFGEPQIMNTSMLMYTLSRIGQLTSRFK
jgi:hypothetical protein